MAKNTENTPNFFEALSALAKEKGIEPNVLIEKIQTALVIAIKKDYPRSENTKFDIDIAKGKFDVSILKDVVEVVEDPANQITLEDARNINKRYNIGDVCTIKLDTKHFGRIAAQTAKQVVVQRIREAERGMVFDNPAANIESPKPKKALPKFLSLDESLSRLVLVTVL